MKIAFTSSAWKQWQKLPLPIQNRLREKLLFYSGDPLRHAIKLTNSKIGDYRFRVGDHRIVFDIVSDEIIILAIGHRKYIYK